MKEKKVTAVKKTVIDKIEVVDKNPLHTKYEVFIKQAKEGYLNGFTYPVAMEMLRYCERKRGTQMGLNMSCSNCMLQLVRVFDNLREV